MARPDLARPDLARPLPGGAAGFGALVAALVVPRLALSYGAAPAPAPAPLPVMPLADLLAVLCAPDIEEAAALVDALHQQGNSAEAICDALLVPACRCLHDSHDAGGCTEAAYALGQARLSMLMHRLPWPVVSAATRPPRTVLTMLAAGCLDDFESALIERRFQRAGWAVRRCGTLAEPEAVRAVRSGWWSIAWIGIGRSGQQRGLGLMIGAMRRASLNPALGVICSGPRRTSPVRLGADALAEDSTRAVAVAEAVVRLRQGELAGSA